MHPDAAFVPPEETLEALASLVEALEPPPPKARVTSHRDTSKRGLVGRRSSEPEPDPEPHPAAPVVPMLRLLDADRMLVPVRDFGWLTPDDARRVLDVLTEVCAGPHDPGAGRVGPGRPR